MTTDFFFEVPRFEELQDPSNSPRREEVGRHTLGAIGGFLPAFFYRARFQLFTQQIPLLAWFFHHLAPPTPETTPGAPSLQPY